jgi:aspartate-semialdehyde dehydrogenase
MFKFGVIGSTGLVGRTMLKILSERGISTDHIRAFASSRSSGKSIRVGNHIFNVELLDPGKIPEGSILLGATSSDIARKWIPECVASGALVIDNSSAFRMDPDVPLVVPEVNPQSAFSHHGIIANPNCSTIQMVVSVYPLLSISEIEWISVSTYQAVSGAGESELQKLRHEQNNNDSSSNTGNIYHENIQLTIGAKDISGYCEEELKLMRETQKILSRSFPIFTSSARVPVVVGHLEAVTIRFRKQIMLEEAEKVLESAPGIRFSENGISPQDTEGTDSVFVGRLRQHPYDRHVLQMWISADNLRKGAALNTVQIAELFLS